LKTNIPFPDLNIPLARLKQEQKWREF